MENKYLEKIASLRGVLKKNRYLWNPRAFKKDIGRVYKMVDRETTKHLGVPYRSALSKSPNLTSEQYQKYMDRTQKFDVLGIKADRAKRKAKKAQLKITGVVGTIAAAGAGAGYAINKKKSK